MAQGYFDRLLSSVGQGANYVGNKAYDFGVNYGIPAAKNVGRGAVGLGQGIYGLGNRVGEGINNWDQFLKPSTNYINQQLQQRAPVVGDYLKNQSMQGANFLRSNIGQGLHSLGDYVQPQQNGSMEQPGQMNQMQDSLINQMSYPMAQQDQGMGQMQDPMAQQIQDQGINQMSYPMAEQTQDPMEQQMQDPMVSQAQDPMQQQGLDNMENNMQQQEQDFSLSPQDQKSLQELGIDMSGTPEQQADQVIALIRELFPDLDLNQFMEPKTQEMGTQTEEGL